MQSTQLKLISSRITTVRPEMNVHINEMNVQNIHEQNHLQTHENHIKDERSEIGFGNNMRCFM